MAKKETAPAKFTIGDLLALLADFTPEEVRDALAANKPGKESAKTGGKSKKSAKEDDDEDEDDEDEDNKKSKAKKGKGKKAEPVDQKVVKKLRASITKMVKAIADEEDEDAEEEVEDLLAEFGVEEVKKLKDDQVTEFAAKLEEIHDDYVDAD